MQEPSESAIATILDDAPPPARSDPATAAITVRLSREQVADVLCGADRTGRDRARAVLEAVAHEATDGLGDEPEDAATAAIMAAYNAVTAGVPAGDAVAAAVAAFGVTWAQIAAALRRAGVPRWKVDVLLVRCGLTERQRRWAIDLR